MQWGVKNKTNYKKSTFLAEERHKVLITGMTRAEDIKMGPETATSAE